MNTRQENGFHGNSKLISYYLEMYCGTHSMNSNYMKVMQQENKRWKSSQYLEKGLAVIHENKIALPKNERKLTASVYEWRAQ